jgi:hypothetical protein
MPDENVRRVYLQKKFNYENNSFILENLVGKSRGFSFAALADLVISVACFDIPIDDAIKILTELEKKAISSEHFNKSEAGFIHE